MNTSTPLFTPIDSHSDEVGIVVPDVVCTHNEWDPLDEVVVGRIEDSVFPPRHPYVLGGVPKSLYNSLFLLGGKKRRPKQYFSEAAQKE